MAIIIANIYCTLCVIAVVVSNYRHAKRTDEALEKFHAERRDTTEKLCKDLGDIARNITTQMYRDAEALEKKFLTPVPSPLRTPPAPAKVERRSPDEFINTLLLCRDTFATARYQKTAINAIINTIKNKYDNRTTSTDNG